MAYEASPGGMILLYGTAIGDALARGQASLEELLALRTSAQTLIEGQGDLKAAVESLDKEIARRGGAAGAQPFASEARTASPEAMPAETRAASRVTLEDLLGTVATAVQRATTPGSGSTLPGGIFPGGIFPGGITTVGIIYNPYNPITGGFLFPTADPRFASTQRFADMGGTSLADMAGNIHGQFFTRILQLRTLTRSQRSAEARRALDELRAKGHLSQAEADHVKQILDSVSDTRRSDPEIADTIRRAASTNISAGTSPLARAITNIALDSIGRAVERGRPPGAPQTGDDPVAHADVEGAIVGAILGSEVPALGTVAGGILGGLASSIAEAI
jgi:uncharacterized protein DUF1843